jgi:carbamoyl-phosphate synthase small subunit
MKGFLILDSGEVFEGQWRGGQSRAGEVVFNTSHSGYEEIATDPSYFSQIVLMTSSMMGNYGVDDKCWESHKIWIEGFICLQLQETQREKSWKTRLETAGVPILSDIDTRKITKRLRSGGTPWGALVQASTEAEAMKLGKALILKAQDKPADWVFLASRKVSENVVGDNPRGPRVAVLDFGSKQNIIRELQSRCREIRVFNSRTSAQEIESFQPDALMLTNGPGDPASVSVAPETIQNFIGKIPIFGICMGHQVLALALGAKTYKLKFGHRGANHPIKDSLLNKIYMSSQNHGYAVEAPSLPKDAQVTHLNLNDMTVAGFFSETRKYLGIQYHPESRPGPHEAVQLFDFFINKMILGKNV